MGIEKDLSFAMTKLKGANLEGEATGEQLATAIQLKGAHTPHVLITDGRFICSGKSPLNQAEENTSIYLPINAHHKW